MEILQTIPKGNLIIRVEPLEFIKIMKTEQSMNNI